MPESCWKFNLCPMADDRYPPCFDASSSYLLQPRGNTVVVVDVGTGQIEQRLHETSNVVQVFGDPFHADQVFILLSSGILFVQNFKNGTKICAVETGLHKIRHVKHIFNEASQTVSLILAATVEEKADVNIYACEYKLGKDEMKHSLLLEKCPKDRRHVDITSDYIAVIRFSVLCLYDWNGNEIKQLSHKKRKLNNGLRNANEPKGLYFSCVACHERTDSLAAGDNLGRILIWRNVLEGAGGVTQVAHWHTLPVISLAWSYEGSSFLSGGAERVLVKWVLHRQSIENKEFLARLPSSILDIVLPEDDANIAICLRDTTIQVVSSAFLPVCSVSALVRRVYEKEATSLPAGVLSDSTGLSCVGPNCIVLNATPGSIQIYQPHKQECQVLDVTELNQPPAERGRVLSCTDVIKIAVCSKYIATVQFREDKLLGDEMLLKIWWKTKSDTGFECVASFDHPHRIQVSHLVFTKTSETKIALISCGLDGKLKVWEQDIESNWQCQKIECFKNFPCTSADFSADGSVLAAAFANFVTLWKWPALVLVKDATVLEEKDSIRSLMFGSENLVLVYGRQSLKAVDCRNLSTVWTVSHKIYHLSKDPFSDVFAAIVGGYVAVFTGSEPKPIVKVPLEGNSVVATVFVNGPEEKEVSRKENQQFTSQLYGITKEMNLLQLCKDGASENIMDIEVEKLENREQSAFAKLIQETRAVQKEKAADTRYDRDYKSNIKLLEGPVHSLPSIDALAQSFVKSCLAPKPELKLPDEMNHNKKPIWNASTIEKRTNAESNTDVESLDLSWMIDCFKKL